MTDHARLRDYVRRAMKRRGGAFPKVRRAARSLRWTQARVLDAAECAKDEGGFDILVGFGIPCVGTAEFDNAGDYELEVYEDTTP
jgi:hypothetical protein